ncbi:hypothetical protein C8R42DRAFT_550961, partial [Lentinula raphanica]
LNSSINESTGFAPFELTYGYIPSMLLHIQKSDEAPPGIRAFGVQAMQSLFDAHDSIIQLKL